MHWFSVVSYCWSRITYWWQFENWYNRVWKWVCSSCTTPLVWWVWLGWIEWPGCTNTSIRMSRNPRNPGTFEVSCLSVHGCCYGLFPKLMLISMTYLSTRINYLSNHVYFCRTCPKNDRKFRDLVSRATQNFDTFEDFGSNLDSDEGKRRVDKTSLDHFYDYSYRRTRKPRMPFSE